MRASWEWKGGVASFKEDQQKHLPGSSVLQRGSAKASSRLKRGSGVLQGGSAKASSRLKRGSSVLQRGSAKASSRLKQGSTVLQGRSAKASAGLQAFTQPNGQSPECSIWTWPPACEFQHQGSRERCNVSRRCTSAKASTRERACRWRAFTQNGLKIESLR